MSKENSNPKRPADQDNLVADVLDEDKDSEWVPFVDTPEYKELHPDDDLEKTKPAATLLQRIGTWSISGAALIAVLIAFVTTTDHSKTTTTHQHPKLTEEEKQEKLAAKEKEELQKLLGQLSNTVRNYLEADTIEQKVKWVRNPERVQSLMQDHYSRHPLTPKSFKRITSKRAAAIWSQPFVLVMAELEDGSKEFLTVDQSADNHFLIDWETHTYYQPVDWETYSDPSQRPSQADMRVYVKPDHYYAAPFSNSKEYECFRLVSRDNKKPVFGYAKIGSPAWHDLRTFFTGRRKGHYHGEPLLLRLRKHQDGDQVSGVVIEKFLSDRWLTPPDMPASPANQVSMIPPNGE